MLAHSHVWKSEGSTPVQNIEERLRDADASIVSHPRLQLDLLCVADLEAWTSFMITFLGPSQSLDWSKMEPQFGRNGSAVSIYAGHTRTQQQHATQFTPIGVFISYLTSTVS